MWIAPSEPDRTEPAPVESPFVTIWESPRATIRHLVAVDPRRHVNALFFVAGMVGVLTALARSRDQFTLAPPIITIVALGYGVMNVPLGHLNAWYKRWVGGLLGGTASRQAVATVGAWSGVPVIVGHGLVLAVQIAIYGLEPFSDDHPTMDAAAPLVSLVFLLASALCTTWSIVISVVGFAEVNAFSVWRSVGTSALALAILMAASTVLAAIAFLTVGSLAP